jgi:hypothetical protein
MGNATYIHSMVPPIISMDAHKRNATAAQRFFRKAGLVARMAETCLPPRSAANSAKPWGRLYAFPLAAVTRLKDRHPRIVAEHGFAAGICMTRRALTLQRDI